jgi:hypothetical protein
MKLTNYKWFRILLGGVWEQYSWYNPLKNKMQSEWRKVHNGKWTEYKVQPNVNFKNLNL